MTARDILLINIELGRIESDLREWLESDKADAHRRRALKHIASAKDEIRAMEAAMEAK